jgi:dCMP deaminase
MEVARVVARRATCLRRRVGAVLVRDNRILATGYNGAPSGVTHCLDTGCLRERLGVPSGERHELCRAVHAEQNVIIQAAQYGVTTAGSTLYVTCQPCFICAKMLVNAGIRRVVCEGPYPDPMAQEILREAGVVLENYPAG